MTRAVLKSQKPHIGIFGKRNCGKSSLINAISSQEVAIVSASPGTTTDPVYKAMELTGFGPVIFIDTAGIDDAGELGDLRVKSTLAVIKEIDLAILLIAHNDFNDYERELINEFEQQNTPYFIIHNKSDLEEIDPFLTRKIESEFYAEILEYSTVDKRNAELLLEQVGKTIPSSAYNNPTIVGDLVSYGDFVLLVTPIDVQAPKGRLILPQVRTIRDCLDNDCISIVLKERELDTFWKQSGIEPKLVVTDSQAFLKVGASVPKHIPLTSFSILFARLKGEFDKYLEGTPQIAGLKNNDRILILESCSHHVAGDDIGRVKIPRWVSTFTGKKLEFELAAGLDSPPRPIGDYSMVIQCGGCMLTRTQVVNRLKPAIDAGIPVSNYGMAIAFCLGIYDRAIEPFVKAYGSSRDYL
ncbi:MAG: [FeFe] hydrogenase H-cluster maturation GTPase HydF [bacterium]|nr:[FeFe] hydrogenase H-cluster maturation GTPase HydF [bacterium]